MLFVLLIFLACCVVSAISIVANVYLYRVLFFELLTEAIWSPMLRINKKLCAGLLIISGVLPFLLFPGTAHLIGPVISSLPYTETTRFWIYLVFSIFPLLCLIPLFFYKFLRRIRNNRFQLRLAEMTGADPSIELLNCECISQTPGRGVLKLTVSINNLVPKFRNVFIETRLTEDLHFLKPSPDKKGDSGWLQASFENNKWIILDGVNDKFLSNNPGLLTYKVRFIGGSGRERQNFPQKAKVFLSARNPVTKSYEYFYYRDLDLRPFADECR